MKTILEHTFKTKCHNLPGLFQGVNTMNALMRRIESQSIIDPDRYPINDYVGDAFEFFVELFLMLHPTDSRVGVYDYHPTQENDNGVDGIGINILAEKCVVQIKYRSNTQGFLTNTEDHLSNMFSDGMLTHGVVADMSNPKNYRHFVFTTAKGLNFYTDAEMFKSKVRCFGNDEFRKLLNNNMVFWNTVREIVNNINN
jgi:hypothetical protein